MNSRCEEPFPDAPQVKMTQHMLASLATTSSPEILSEGPHVVTLRESADPAPPLWCLLGIQRYAELARAFPREGAVFGIDLPSRHRSGRNSRASVEQIAESCLREIRARQPKGPYRLAGAGLGGVVAFELATRLERLGEKLELVAVLDALLPTGMRIDAVGRIIEYAERAKSAPRRLAGWCAQGWRSSYPTPATSNVCTPPEVARYAKRAQHLGAPLLVVRATAEPRPSWLRVDPDLGWHGFATKVIAHDVPGKHGDMLERPYVASVAQLMGDLTRARRHLRCVK